MLVDFRLGSNYVLRFVQDTVRLPNFTLAFCYLVGISDVRSSCDFDEVIVTN